VQHCTELQLVAKLLHDRCEQNAADDNTTQPCLPSLGLETGNKAFDRAQKGLSYLQLKHQKMDIQLQSLLCHQWGLCTTGIQSLHCQTHHLPHQGSHGLAPPFEAPEMTLLFTVLSSQELASLCCARTSHVRTRAHLHAISSQ